MWHGLMRTPHVIASIVVALCKIQAKVVPLRMVRVMNVLLGAVQDGRSTHSLLSLVLTVDTLPCCSRRYFGEMA
jgi:hypothetical protein